MGRLPSGHSNALTFALVYKTDQWRLLLDIKVKKGVTLLDKTDVKLSGLTQAKGHMNI